MKFMMMLLNWTSGNKKAPVNTRASIPNKINMKKSCGPSRMAGCGNECSLTQLINSKFMTPERYKYFRYD